MTPAKDQTQALIAEIDTVLSKSSPRLPWVMSGDASEQRQLLEKLRRYLATQPPSGMPTGRSPVSLSVGEAGASGQHPEVAQQLAQAVWQEMEGLRANLMQPWQNEMESLRQQREALIQEIRQLERQRQQTAFGGGSGNQQQLISEFLQALMERLQESLSYQVSQTLATTLRAQAGDPALFGQAQAGYLPEGTTPLLNPAQRLENLQTLQTQSDQLLLKLDATLKVVFEALERDIQSYQESLSQGLDKMHSLGHQGEMMFATLINRLAQMLGREASSYVQSSLQAGDLGTATPRSTVRVTAVSPTGERSPISMPIPFNPADLDQGLFDRLAERGLPYADSGLGTASVEVSRSQPPSSSLEDLDLEDLDLSDLNLDNVELDALAEEDEEAIAADLLLDLEANRPATASFGPESEVDEALEFLNDLSANLPSEAVGESFPTRPEVDLLSFEGDELEAALAAPELDLELGPEILPEAKAAASLEPPAPQPDLAELDEFYASLFGSEARTEATPRVVETAAAPPTEEPSASEDLLSGFANLEVPLPAPELDSLTPLDLAASLGTLPEVDATPLPSEPDIFIDSLFGDAGFLETPAPEPAIAPETVAPTAEARITPSQTPTEETASLLNLLGMDQSFLSDQGNAETLSMIAELLGEESTASQAPVAPSTPSAPVTPVEVDAIAEPATPPLGLNLEESYIAAPPEENLLVTDEELDAEPDLDLWLSPSTLQQLSEDLSNLEGLENGNFGALETDFGGVPEPLSFLEPEGPVSSGLQPPLSFDLKAPMTPATPAASEETAWTLDDFAEALPLEPMAANPDAFAMPPNPTEESAENGGGSLEDFLASLDDELSVSAADSPAQNTPAPLPEPIPPAPVDPGTLTQTGMTLDDIFADFPGTSAASETEKKKFLI